MERRQCLRVGLLTNIPTPYRLPLFQLLSKQPTISLDVAFNASSESNRLWQLPSHFDFRYTVLAGKTLALRHQDLTSYHINWGLRKWIERGSFDVVIIGGWASLAQQMAVLLCRRRDIPVVLWSGSTAGEPSLGRAITRPLVHKLVKWSDAYIAYGTASKRYLQALGALNDRIAVAPNTIDVNAWATTTTCAEVARLREGLGLTGRLVFLYVGQLIRRKGVDLLLSAFSQVRQHYPQCALVIAGAGPLEARLRRQADECGLDCVRFVGQIPYEQLPTYYSSADAVVLPSRSEVWGLTLNEAMAAARPVITTDVTGAAEDLVLDRQTGWKASAHSEASLAACLEDCVLQGAERRRLMGDTARQLIRSRFTLHHSVEGFLQAIRLASIAPASGCRLTA
jgi:glycosyltransferase involved in cell wall biosynthesis